MGPAPLQEVFSDGRIAPVPAWQIGVQATFAFLAAVFVSLRLYSRLSLKRRIEVDDCLLIAGLVGV